jgi:predicted dehydrogenase
MSDDPSLRILVIGAGSIGRRHLANLVAMKTASLAVCDCEPRRLHDCGVTAFTDLSRALAEFAPQQVVVCTPPDHHAGMLELLLEFGADVYLEKPAATRRQDLDAAMALVPRTDRVVQVGYQLPFDEGYIRLKQVLQSGDLGSIRCARFEFGHDLAAWRPAQDYRDSYSASAERGGGILLDASHEIHACIDLLGAANVLTAHLGRVSALDVDAEDCANVLLECGGVVAEVHLDYVRPHYRRVYDIVGETGCVRWDEGRRIVEVTRSDGSMKRWCAPGAYADAYVAAMGSFVECALRRQPPRVDLAAGAEVLEVVDAARRSAATAAGSDERSCAGALR